MELSIRKSSGKSPLQEQLDREQVSSASTTGVEELPSEELEALREKPLFGKPRKAVFHVDLLGGWLKP